MPGVHVRAVLVGLSLAAGVVAPAAALPPTISLAELQRWFDSIPNARVVMAQPHDWQYTFTATNGRSLEPLSQALVRGGYRLVALEGGAMAVLHMAKAELHSPLTLVKRNEVLAKTARTYGATYDSWSVTL